MCENKSVHTHIVPTEPLKGLRLLNNMITILTNSVAEECACMSSIDQDSNGLWERLEARLNWVNVYNALTLMIKLKKKRSPIYSRKCLGDCWYPEDVVSSLSFSSISLVNG